MGVITDCKNFTRPYTSLGITISYIYIDIIFLRFNIFSFLLSFFNQRGVGLGFAQSLLYVKYIFLSFSHFPRIGGMRQTGANVWLRIPPGVPLPSFQDPPNTPTPPRNNALEVVPVTSSLPPRDRLNPPPFPQTSSIRNLI